MILSEYTCFRSVSYSVFPYRPLCFHFAVFLTCYFLYAFPCRYQALDRGQRLPCSVELSPRLCTTRLRAPLTEFMPGQSCASPNCLVRVEAITRRTSSARWWHGNCSCRERSPNLLCVFHTCFLLQEVHPPYSSLEHRGKEFDFKANYTMNECGLLANATRREVNDAQNR